VQKIIITLKKSLNQKISKKINSIKLNQATLLDSILKMRIFLSKNFLKELGVEPGSIVVQWPTPSPLHHRGFLFKSKQSSTLFQWKKGRIFKVRKYEEFEKKLTTAHPVSYE
jgi:hypothetical protein